MPYFTIDPGTDHVAVDTSTRRGSVVFSVQNKSGVARQIRSRVSVEDPAQEDWYTVKEPVQQARVDETLQFSVDVAVPPEVEAGRYHFRLTAVAEDDPDDVHDVSQQVPVQVPPDGGGKFPWWIVAVVVAVVAVAVVMWIVVGNDGGVGVPDVGGLTVEAAQERLVSAGLALGDVTEQPSDEEPEGRVVAQDPAAGTDVEPGTAVDLVVSSGVPNGALQFDGENDFVSVPNTTGDFNFQTQFTVEAWVRPQSVASNGSFAAVVQHAKTLPPFSGSAWTLFLDRNDHSRWGLSVCVPGCDSASSGVGNLQVGQWQHLAATYDGAQIRIYRDGQLLDVAPHTGQVSNANVLLIGIWEDSFHGLIDEVRVWNVARSQNDVTATMNETLSGDLPGLVGYWRFDEQTGQLAEDSSGAGNDGHLGAGAGSEASDPQRVPSDAPVD